MPELIVVGAGPVGCLIALLAARRGTEVLVVERRAEVSERPRAIGVFPPAAAVLREAGVSLHGAARIRRGTARDGPRVLATLEFAEPVLSLPQHRIERSVRGLLAAEPSARVLTGVAAGALHREGSAVELEVGAQRHTARLVVAADGVGSGLRAAAGIEFEPVAGSAEYLMADVPDETGFDEEAALWFGAYGVVESFPMPGGARRWVARIGPVDGDLATLVAERTGVHPVILRGAVSSFQARQHLAGRWVSDGLVLLGDAAHEISPIGGQGMNLGVLDAARLAGPLARALGGDPAALQEWESSRRPAARRAMAQARFNMAVGAPWPRGIQPLRRAGIRVLSLWRSRLAETFTMQHL